MPALDSCHYQVVGALQKAGWKVADKPKYVDDADTETFVYIDIEAVQESNGLSAFNAVFRRALRDNRIMMVVVDLETETITQWIE